MQAAGTAARESSTRGASATPGASRDASPGPGIRTIRTDAARRVNRLYRPGREYDQGRDVAHPAAEPDTAESLDVLVARAVDGDVDAWEQLYLAAYPRLYGYAAHRVGADGARDVVNETMTRALARVASFRRDGVFEAWLFGICRNVIREHLRHTARPIATADATASRAADPADEVVALDEQMAVRQAVARLPERDREVLELRVIAGLSAEAVAEVLHKRPGAVRMAQSRALARLRSLLLVEGVRA